MSFSKLSVGLGARAYDIHIGADLLQRSGQILAPHLNRMRTFIVADARVRALHGAKLESGLGAEGVSATWIEVAPGEASKSFATLERVVGDLIAGGADRRDLVLAFGGGVVGDLAGFAAAIMKRGCAYAQIPTTLLAQVDSAVGGKTAVNLSQGKNLAGLFHQPVAVIADIAALDTLPERELRAGYAEIVKYGALGDREFFSWLEAAGGAPLSGDRSLRAEAVRRSLSMKAAIIERDETETGERALLNLGHTFGHALESAYGFSNSLLHGEAVAAGMGLAFDFSVRQGLCDPAEGLRLKAHLRACGLADGVGNLPEGPALDAKALLASMFHDKKTVSGRLNLVLARGLGAAFIAENVDPAAIEAFLAEAIAAR